MKQLTMHNGDVRDARICHRCQQPGADVQGEDGEWYHDDCYGELTP